MQYIFKLGYINNEVYDQIPNIPENDTNKNIIKHSAETISAVTKSSVLSSTTKYMHKQEEISGSLFITYILPLFGNYC